MALARASRRSRPLHPVRRAGRPAHRLHDRRHQLRGRPRLYRARSAHPLRVGMRRRPLAHATFTLGAAITLALVGVAGLSLLYTPADPLTMSITGRLQGPSGGHPFGTDQFGRDILSRVMAGAVTSIAVGVIAVGIGAALGVLLGLLSGYVGGWLDETLMRLVDAVQGFPAILSALLFTAVFAPGTGVSMVAIGIAFVPAFARLTRGAVPIAT